MSRPRPGALGRRLPRGHRTLARLAWIRFRRHRMALALAVAVGTAVGAAAGYYGGWPDNLLMRVTDMMLSFPALFVLILLALVLRTVAIPFLRGGVLAIVIVIAVLSWMTVARLVRASFLALREAAFVEAGRGLGAGSARLMLRHILPNSLSP